eukprot:1158959-Pelagomonas_calceolata.AAC.11
MAGRLPSSSGSSPAASSLKLCWKAPVAAAAPAAPMSPDTPAHPYVPPVVFQLQRFAGLALQLAQHLSCGDVTSTTEMHASHHCAFPFYFCFLIGSNTASACV